jgi:hypothetical protein
MTRPKGTDSKTVNVAKPTELYIETTGETKNTESCWLKNIEM